MSDAVSAGVTTHRFRFVPAAIWAAAIWFASSRVWTGVPTRWDWLPEWLPLDKGAHAVLFAVLAGLLAVPLARKTFQTLMVCWIGATLWGAVDEWHQFYVPGRQMDAFDLVADAVGAALAVAAVAVAVRVRRRAIG